ncbi:GYD domain-containing protein [Aporhodopirellula aestuarii]|uniref:GYD domain-containing protein n=1 Tax=Aporhodopirellula aestuarii TaxID=2950107 RepID=A0ABT0TY40_9BACT|nr:GYD domain-containing protein [Aporhodopirellula aestuarii]MCM2369485.1 GYD domain-containing protein [Aporhodopirellula aestuarii]
MFRYLTLIQFTDQGARNVDKSVQRASDFGKSVSDAGGKLISQVWTVGKYDGCVVFETPDESTSSALLVKLAKDGNVRTQTMRCYDNQEFADILKVIS